jgi:hypothetical protein
VDNAYKVEEEGKASSLDNLDCSGGGIFGSLEGKVLESRNWVSAFGGLKQFSYNASWLPYYLIH